MGCWRGDDDLDAARGACLAVALGAAFWFIAAGLLDWWLR